MPRQKDLKRLVRTRMKRTGESYTTARAQVLKNRPTRAATKTAPRPTAPAPIATGAPVRTDYAAVAGMSDSAVQEKTGRNWEEWVRTLDKHDAATMVHRDIAKLVSGTYKLSSWWSQMVTVGYERIKGLRAHGQRRDGTYEAGKSRTYTVPVATLFDAWADTATRRRWLDATGVKVRSVTKPKAMRLDWTDGTVVTVWFTSKGKDKSTVAVSHTKLPDKAATNRLKQYWAERLNALGDVLA